jgi:hypothetical protein
MIISAMDRGMLASIGLIIASLCVGLLTPSILLI